MCMFEDEDLGKVFKYSRGQVSFQCGPAIDIGTDLSVWSCFPLSKFYTKSLFEFSSFQEIVTYYGRKWKKSGKKLEAYIIVAIHAYTEKKIFAQADVLLIFLTV